MTTALGNNLINTVTASVAERAAALDEQRTDVRPDLAQLGQAGLFDPALADSTLPDMVRVIEEVSAHSLAVGFSAWAHTMALQYLRRAPEPFWDSHIDELRAGSRIGVTAMAAGLKQVAGLGQVPLVAQSHGVGLRITGPIHWASNLFAGALIVLPARTDSGQTCVTAVDIDAPGVTVDPPPALMALGATVSSSLRLDDVGVPPEQILSTDLHGFVTAIRPTFLLLQTAFCVGVGVAALAGARESAGALADQFTDDVTQLSEKLGSARERLYALAADTSHAHPAEFARLRLDAATYALAATRLEFTFAGGAGYVAGSAANRRFREAAFLPVQSPSEGQLRWELNQYE